MRASQLENKLASRFEREVENGEPTSISLFSPRVLKFTIEGVVVSGNQKTRFAAIPVKEAGEFIRDEKGDKTFRIASFSTKEAKEYDERVRSIAQFECLRQRWPLTEYVRLDLILFNQRVDRDNAHKTIADGMEGLVFPNDGRILDGWIRKVKDGGRPRARVIVTELDPRQYGY